MRTGSAMLSQAIGWLASHEAVCIVCQTMIEKTTVSDVESDDRDRHHCLSSYQDSAGFPCT